MAIVEQRQCDACGKINTGKRKVTGMKIISDEGIRHQLDLCGPCFNSLKAEYGATPVSVAPRRRFEVVNPDEIELLD